MCPNPQEFTDLVTFTEEILNGKLHFLCSVKYLFHSSLQSGIFPDLLKITIVSPVFKIGDTVEISNYRPISVLPCFSKILERIMCNRLCKCLTDQKILHPQQFGFQKGHSIEHAIPQLVDETYESFEIDNYTVGIFVELPKAFHAVDHTIFLKELEIYGITGVNLAWFMSYVTNRKQYICNNNSNKTNKKK